MAIGPGSRIGPYEVTALIGEGGMGKVWRGRHTALKREDALKLLPEEFSADKERLLRFQREAQVLASLNHPNIAHVYGLEVVDEGPALVLELVEGPTLADRLATGAIPVEEAVAVARQIALALESAHEKGIVHRDLKPANVKLRDDGVVKVLDFGLAKALERGTGIGDHSSASVTRSPTITTPAMTQVGMILGTPAYMAPEQARGKHVDKRADIWAFGCVLFEMLSGVRAFDGEDVTDMIAAVVRAEPRWQALPADVPAPIRLLLQRCLEKDPRKRVGDISAASFVLSEPALVTAGADGIGSARKSPMWKRAIPVLAGAAASALLVGGVAWMLRPQPAPPTVTRFPIILPQGQQLTNVGRPAISQDGTRIVYVANLRLYMRSMSDSVPRELFRSEDGSVNSPTFSPDGRWVAFVYGNELKRVSVDGGAAAKICDVSSTPLGVSWSTDGILFGVRPGHIYRVNPTGGTPERVFTASDEEAAFGARLLPGGLAMLFTLGTVTSRVQTPDSNPDQLANPRIVWQSLESGERVTVIERGADAQYLPTGHIVYADGATLNAVRFDLQERRVVGDSVPVIEGVRRSDFALSAHYAVSDSGTLVYVPRSIFERRGLGFRDRDGRLEPLKVPGAAYNAPRLSPDGKWIAVEATDGKALNIHLYETSGASSMRQLTLQGNNRYPVWSADGTRVAYASDRTGPYAVWWQRADGSGAPEPLMEPEKGTEHSPLSFHPFEQTLLVLVRTIGRGMSLWTYSLADKKAQPFAAVSSFGNLSAQFSPDGKWVAYHTLDRPNGGASVYLRPYPNMSQEVRRIAPGSHAVWRPNSSELFFVRQQIGELYVTTVTTQPSFATSPVATVPVGDIQSLQTFWRNYDISPDGKVLMVTPSGDGEESQRIEVVLDWTEELKRLLPR